MLEGNGTIVHVLFSILLRRHVGKVMMGLRYSCCSQIVVCFALTKISFMDFFCDILRSMRGVLNISLYVGNFPSVAISS